jgi:hypothetical protein
MKLFAAQVEVFRLAQIGNDFIEDLNRLLRRRSGSYLIGAYPVSAKKARAMRPRAAAAP